MEFDSQFAAAVIGSFSVEFWCQSGDYRDPFLVYLDELVCWTAERLLPSWADNKQRQRRATDLFEWIRAISGLIASILPFVSTDEMINRFIMRFSGEASEDALEVVSDIADKIVYCHVYDAHTVADATLAVLCCTACRGCCRSARSI